MENYVLTRYEAYERKLNIRLLNEIISFITSSSEQTNPLYFRELPGECMWYYRVENTIPEELGFRYPGELLERYEERFGSDIKDIRAIALGLAYTAPIHETQMFIGAQKSDFIYRIRKLADNDFYLQIALYYLDGQKTDDFHRLISTNLTETEDVLLQAWLYPEPDSSFSDVKERLVKAYSTGRTISAIHNAGLFAKLISRFYYVLQNYKKKDAMVLKRIFMLKDVLFKPDSKEYADLLSCGYSEDEIKYLNFILADYTNIPTKIPEDGIIAEKIAVEFCRYFLNSEHTHSEDTYKLIDAVLAKYHKFKIRYEENKGILDALYGKVDIINPVTFARLHERLHSDYVCHFDIMDDKWSALATELSSFDYWLFVANKLADIKEIDTIKKWLVKYEELADRPFIARFDDDKHISLSTFNHLVKVGYINLLEYYEQTMLLSKEIGDENVIRSNRMYYIRNKVERVNDRQDFEFFRRFFGKYGYKALKSELGISNFYRSFTIAYGYSDGKIGSIKINRDFLSEDEQREVLGWLNGYIFEEYIEMYVSFIEAILKNDEILALYYKEDVRKLYLAYCKINKDASNDYGMIKKFLTVKEIEDYENRQKENERIKEIERLAREKADAESKFETHRTSWDSLYKLFSSYYERTKKEFFRELARNNMKELIREMPITCKEEFISFLDNQIVFLNKGFFTHDEIMDNIFLAKEFMSYETNDTESITD